jgi:hypothetical protein
MSDEQKKNEETKKATPRWIVIRRKWRSNIGPAGVGK